MSFNANSFLLIFSALIGVFHGKKKKSVKFTSLSLPLVTHCPLSIFIPPPVMRFLCVCIVVTHYIRPKSNGFRGPFWGEFCLSIILPWSCSKVTKKFCRKLFTWNENFHFKFFRNPSIFGRAVNKKMISLCFTGPFWAFLGTPTITYHHDSLSISLLHQEV